MTLRRLLPVTLALGLMAAPSLVLADDAGPGPEPEPEEEDSGEEEEEEDDKGCAHVMLPQNLAIFGAGLLVFVVASRRGSPHD